VLTCGDDPISLIKGLQYGRTYSALQTLYRKDYAPLSPGAAALYLVVEDLLKHRPAQLIGSGEPNQKHHTSNVTLEMICLLPLKKALGNRLRRGVHAAFFSAVRFAKRIRDRIEFPKDPEPCATYRIHAKCAPFTRHFQLNRGGGDYAQLQTPVQDDDIRPGRSYNRMPPWWPRQPNRLAARFRGTASTPRIDQYRRP